MSGQIYISFTGRDVADRDFSVLTSHSVKTITAQFDFDSVWDAFETKTAIFAGGSTVISQLLDAENSCVVPWEVLAQSGSLTIGVVGQSGEKIMPSVKVIVPIVEGIYTNGTTPSEPTPDVYEQIVQLMQQTLEIAQTALGAQTTLPSRVEYLETEIAKCKTAYLTDSVLYAKSPFVNTRVEDGVLYADGGFSSAKITNNILYVK